jgi:hypothetical protein
MYLYPWIHVGLVTRDNHVKHQSTSTYYSNVIVKIKVSGDDRWTKLHTGQKQYAFDLDRGGGGHEKTKKVMKNEVA